MIIVKVFFIFLFTHSRSKENESWGQFTGLSIGKYLLVLGDVLGSLPTVSIKMNHYFKISQDNSLHTQHRCIERA
ncbi:hypothetical protein WM45_13300 [Citrobacter sp. AATXR]|nr:hypothetical protein WM45_13300 [Citrobacter sp. AATXR]